MDCPLCFANAGPGFNLTLEEVERHPRSLCGGRGQPGGRAVLGRRAVHPSADHPDAARGQAARHPPRDAQHQRQAHRATTTAFWRSWPRCRPDDLLPVRRLRARDLPHHSRRARLLPAKLRALDRLAAIGLHRRAGAGHRARRQPGTRSARSSSSRIASPRRERHQLPARLPRRPAPAPSIRCSASPSPTSCALIERRPAACSSQTDFVPVPCCFPTCNSVTYA